MNEWDRANTHSAPQPSGPPGGEGARGIVALTKDLIARARERAEEDRREAASRRPITRALLALTLLAIMVSGATFVYGIYSFPDGPIRPSGDGYVSKAGKQKSRSDYDKYLSWSLAMWVTYPATFIIAFTFMYFDSRDRRRSRGQALTARPDAGG